MKRHTPKDWTYDKASGEVRAHGGVVALVNTIEERGEADGMIIAAAPEMAEALHASVKLIEISRKYFPKSIHDSDRFQLENTCAEIGKAIAKTQGGAK